MIDVINLALPYFGLIVIGFACGKFKRIPESALGWMNFFTLYVALPALFFRILAKTPLQDLAQPKFVIATTLATALAFGLAFAVGMTIRSGGESRSAMRDATIAGLAGGYGNIGYMGPGLALATLGPEAAVPVALIFCFDNIVLFSLVPTLMAFSSRRRGGIGKLALDVVRRIVLHPLLVATGLGVLFAAIQLQPPVAIDRLLAFLQNAAAPCALFTLGVTVALRPLRALPLKVPLLAIIKLAIHPVIALVLLSVLGGFSQVWVYTAVLMAALPPALNVFIFARQYDAMIEEASSSVLFGTAVSVVTLTTVMWMVKTQILPVDLFPQLP